MAYDDDNDNIPFQLGDRDKYTATVYPEYEDAFEQELADEERRLHNFEHNRSHSTRTVSSLDSQDGIGHVEYIRAHLDVETGIPRISYVNHRNVLEDNYRKNRYDPFRFKLFDAVINDYLHDDRKHDAIDNPDHQYFDSYGPLRDNIATLRMVLYTQYFPDGQYNGEDPKDKSKLAKISQISHRLAHELKWEARWQTVKNVLTLGLAGGDLCEKRFGDYGKAHLGAAFLYRKLYDMQEKPSKNPFSWLSGSAKKFNWGLEPPEQSAFSRKDMEEALYNVKRDEKLGMERASGRLAELAASTQLGAAVMSDGIRQMSDPDREQSVEEGRNILRNLKDILAGRSERTLEGIEHKRLDLERAEMLDDLRNNYTALYQDMLAQDPSLANDPVFQRAQLALGKLGHITLEDALDHATREEEREIRAVQEELPEEFRHVGDDTEEALLRDVEVAMHDLTQLNTQYKRQKQQQIISEMNLDLQQVQQVNQQMDQFEQMEQLEELDLARDQLLQQDQTQMLAQEALLNPELQAQISSERGMQNQRIMNEMIQDQQFVQQKIQNAQQQPPRSQNQQTARQLAQNEGNTLMNTMSNARFGAAAPRQQNQARTANQQASRKQSQQRLQQQATTLNQDDNGPARYN